MQIDERIFELLVFKRYDDHIRFTQDSPIYPDVWREYFVHASELDTYRVDLIFFPHRDSSAPELLLALSRELETNADLATSGDSVAARLTFDELIKVALPMTSWWQTYLIDDEGDLTQDANWLKSLIAAIQSVARGDTDFSRTDLQSNLPGMLVSYFNDFLGRAYPFPSKQKRKNQPIRPLLWSVNRNRPATITLERSVGTTKGDAGRKVFDIDGSGITWAVLDSGIDATHLAFRKRDPKTGKLFAKAMGAANDPFSNNTRIVASYDFTKFRSIISEIFKKGSRVKDSAKRLVSTTSDRNDQQLSQMQLDQYLSEVEKDLKSGYVLDWSMISPLLRIPHNDTEYVLPVYPHGTHVAGILGAGSYDENNNPMLIGMCPGISIYDIRVMNERGEGNEFDILAALQFVRWMNNQRDGQVIHGVNLSFSMVHVVASYACGATPACLSCERLVAEGTIVVAAAGNLGQTIYQDTDRNSAQGFRMVNITDPGNAESVITVGSTHKDRPHSFGISYFSSKGPTGDGRVKPDIVAPGEKIISAVPDNATKRMDGTSMAAPHVSGAAALLLAKHRELIGKPMRVKSILCKTATDLGREKYFQGCGMVDVLRAIQSV